MDLGVLVCRKHVAGHYFGGRHITNRWTLFIVMGLDAFVHCNCFEARNLREAPPYPDLITVSADGSLEFLSADLEILLALDEWLNHRACAHQSGILLHHRIGNIAMVGLLRTELAREPEKYPVILKQILYNGMHGGDYLSLEDVDLLRSELVSLNAFVGSDLTTMAHVESFRRKMCELTDASQVVGNPISF